MRPDWADLLDRRLSLPLSEGPDKVTTAAGALRRLVEPGQTIYLGTAHGRPTALVRELVRQWWGKTPAWTVATTGIGSPWTALVVGGLVRRLVTTFVGEGYPMPAPQPLAAAAILGGRVEVQNWSMLTLPLRLIAGALGVPFLPTRSLLGSSMEEDNARDGAFVALPDPFDPTGGRVGLVRALRPDVALLHAWAADRAGNVLGGAPLNEGFYGAMAARRVVVSVEKVVSTDFIRRHAAVVRLPGHYVSAVVEAPLGSHPGAMHGLGVPELEPYAEDLEFILDVRRAFRAEDTARRWIEEWMLGVPDQAAYLAKLGAGRVQDVRERAHPEFWRREVESLEERLTRMPERPSASEHMVVAAARLIGERVRQERYSTCLAGVGNAHLAAWLAVLDLRAAGVEVELVAEVGMIGYAPRPADPFVFAFRNIPTSKMLTDIVHALGIVVGGAGSRCIGSLAAGQVDRFGNINSTLIPGTAYITGSGGANDVAAGAREVIVTLPQSRRRFVEKTPYVTAPGDRVTAVVSDRAIYEKLEGGGELVLTGLLGDGPEAEQVAAARASCGWDVKVADRLRPAVRPTTEELRLVRLFDPRRYFLGDEP